MTPAVTQVMVSGRKGESSERKTKKNLTSKTKSTKVARNYSTANAERI